MKKNLIYLSLIVLTFTTSCSSKTKETKETKNNETEMSAEDAALEKEFEELDQDVKTIEDTLKK